MNSEKVNKTRSFLQIQIAVMLFGGAGLLGKLIPLNPVLLVFGRATWAALFLLVWILLGKYSWKQKKLKNIFYLFIQGMVLAFHWVAFFKCIQLGTVALAVLTFSAFPLFTMFLAPIFNEGKVSTTNVISALFIIGGVGFMIPFDDINGSYLFALIWGILAALSFSVLIILNKVNSKDYNPFEFAFWQNFYAAIILSPSIFFYNIELSYAEYSYWLILGTVFTGLSHGLYTASLKGLSVQTASLFAAMEPIYAIIFAWIFIGEHPFFTEIIGACFILTALFINEFFKKQIVEYP
jgi:drug/metabolite transporter (DMT)-like permease